MYYLPTYISNESERNARAAVTCI